MDHLPRARPIRQEEVGLGCGKALQVSPAAFDALDEERVVQRVACGARTGQDGDAQYTLHGPSGARVHDVRVRDAVLLEGLLVAAGHGESPILQPDGERDTAALDRILDPDVPPSARGRGAQAEDRAAAGADQGGGDALPPEQVHGAVHGVSLGDPTQVQLDPGPVEADGPVFPVQPDVLVADASPQLGQLGAAGHPAGAAEEAPRLHQRTDGDVEGAVGLAAVPERFGDQVEQLRVDGHRSLRRLPVEARQGALRLVMAHQPVDAIHLVEGRLDDARQRGGVIAVGDDGVRAAHRHADRLVADERPRRAR